MSTPSPEFKVYCNISERKIRSPKLTPVETVTKGLMADPKEVKARFTIKCEEGKGRGVYLAIPLLKKNSFVLEYEGDLVSESEACSREQIYAQNNEGCYIMSFIYKGARMAIDATRHFDSYTRLLNHSRHPNIKFHTPIILDLSGNGKPRIGAYALRDIRKGEEIVFDYGVRDGDIPWLRNKKAGFYTNLDSSEEEEERTPNITMRISSPNKDSPQNSNNDPSTSYSCQYTNLKKKKEGTTLLKDRRVNCGWKFTKVFGQNYLLGLENEGCPQKILRIIEEGSRKQRQRMFTNDEASNSVSDESVLSRQEKTCLSISEESVLSRQEHTSDTAELVDLPHSVNSSYSSLSKVLDWLPSIQKVQSLNTTVALSRPVHVNNMDETHNWDPSISNIRIEKVQSLSEADDYHKETKLGQPHSSFVVIEDSSEEETAASSTLIETPNIQGCTQKFKRNIINKIMSPDVLVISDEESPNSLPSRRPVGFCYTTAPVQVAVIKPYDPKIVDDCALSPSDNQKVNGLTISECKQLKTIFERYVLSDKFCTDDIYSTIEKNWEFFKELIERGISVDEIRSTVRGFFKSQP
ncbi:hypothetical protein Btru_027359 [Bulinus truncatus]|nr:hypothetical protein Btru_027359 [Bulinus truncatus]